MSFEWPYYSLIEGKLYIKTRKGLVEAFRKSNHPHFATSNEAEAWLLEQGLRGSVRESGDETDSVPTR